MLGYRNSSLAGVGTQFGIVGTVNGTVVTIVPSVTTGARSAGVPYTITINQGQTYQLTNTGTNLDLSGTIITATQPIAVFGGHSCANIPPGVTYCDFVVEQLPPVTAWGESFVTVPLATRKKGDTFRFVASSNNTAITVNGTIVATLNKGAIHEMIISQSALIKASNPIIVAQYSNGTSFDNVVSDPFMMLIPPFEQFLGSYTVTTPASGFQQNFINIVAPNAAVGNIKLDGATIPASSFTAIGSSGFSGAQLSVKLGVHNVTGSGSLPFGVFVYGFDEYDSYGYPGGQSLAPIATVTTVTITPKNATNQVNTEHCVTATVKDQNNNPVAGVRVDFSVSGANTAVGFSNTAANGTAQFCYKGTNAGTDKITASVGTLSDQATKIWTDAPKQDQTITFGPIGDKTLGDAPFALTATASSGLPVSFSVVSGPATLSGNVLTLTGMGTVVVRATQAGNATYNPAPPVERQFTVKPADTSQAVLSFTLVDADSDKDIMPLKPGDVLNLAALPSKNLSVRATTNPASVGSVVFKLSGSKNYQTTENIAPYALFGGSATDYTGQPAVAGNYTLTATPYSQLQAKGIAGQSLTVHFKIVNSSARIAAEKEGQGPATIRAYPNPFQQEFTLEVSEKQTEKLPARLYDLQGRVVLEVENLQQLQTIPLDQTHKPGVYFLEVGSGNRAKRLRLLKIR